ncbi:S8 family serine peptidase [Kineosporia mesophila]|uniref:S8 family serine peptidase n=2 Tax=Kineosporia mesophila TaxID=566012 RepID=A0ABP6ZRE4_9ACTN
MRSRRSVVSGLVLALAAFALAVPPATANPVAGATVSHDTCGEAPAGHMRCFSTWTPGESMQEFGASAVKRPKGISAADIRSAYKLPASGDKGKGMTVAVVDAYTNPHAEKNLKVYRKVMGLKPCTTKNHCFRTVNGSGGTKMPEADASWGVEINLDVQAVSAACPNCNILLVAAKSSDEKHLGQAVRTAARLGADVISNSYGRDENGSMGKLGRTYFEHPGIPMVVSTGDAGFRAASFPAVLGTSIAVGGTTLKHTAAGKWRERAWENSGSGCSAWIAKPAWQKDKHCGMRTTADLSALADNFAVYDTFGLGEENGWLTVGGTSLSAPLVAGMIALAGHPEKVTPASVTRNHALLRDITSGPANGDCGDDYLCQAATGYDAPTGWGSPRGLKVFS